jgi:hypothetical protein
LNTKLAFHKIKVSDLILATAATIVDIAGGIPSNLLEPDSSKTQPLQVQAVDHPDVLQLQLQPHLRKPVSLFLEETVYA